MYTHALGAPVTPLAVLAVVQAALVADTAVWGVNGASEVYMGCIGVYMGVYGCIWGV